jgi:hypothetical protein
MESRIGNHPAAHAGTSLHGGGDADNMATTLATTA